eukprot:scaffold126975_cov40-Tisochrysis_lutea.AAC.2
MYFHDVAVSAACNTGLFRIYTALRVEAVQAIVMMRWSWLLATVSARLPHYSSECLVCQGVRLSMG